MCSHVPQERTPITAHVIVSLVIQLYSRAQVCSLGLLVRLEHCVIHFFWTAVLSISGLFYVAFIFGNFFRTRNNHCSATLLLRIERKSRSLEINLSQAQLSQWIFIHQNYHLLWIMEWVRFCWSLVRLSAYGCMVRNAESLRSKRYFWTVSSPIDVCNISLWLK